MTEFPDIASKIDRATRLMEASRDHEAIFILEQVIARVPGNGQARLMMAQALTGSGREDEALEHLLAATQDPESAGLAFGMLGYWYQSRGVFQDSRDCFIRSIQIKPNQSLSYYGWTQSNRTTDDNRSIFDGALALLESGVTSHEDSMVLHYVLGKGHAELGDYESSIRHYDLANHDALELLLDGKSFDRAKYAHIIDGTLSTFNKEFFQRIKTVGSNSRQPIFVVGMMRSGTTLVEQILSSHPAVSGAGELGFWLDQGTTLFDGSKKIVDFKKLAQASTHYLGLLNSVCPGSESIVDKMPQNFQMLGLIHTAFPKAPIIHIRRHPIDTCLSIYTTAYQESPAFAHDRSSIVFAYRQYQRMVAHWRKVIPPNRLLEVDYEDLISNPETNIRKILAFCGLPFDDACLRPESNQRVVTTPSLWQVRQPIYKTSVERWRVYEPWLGVFSELKP